MKIAKIARYVKHVAFRGEESANGSPAVHAMRRGQTVAVDAHAFLYSEPVFTDAVYPDEQCTGGDAFVSASFAKGGTYYSIRTKASELARVLGRGNLPDEWFGR